MNGRPLPPELLEGRIRLCVGALDEERIGVRLLRSGCRIEPDVADPDLVVYCDAAQLDTMLVAGHSTSPLRVSGERALLSSLATMMAPGKTPLEIRTCRA